MRGILYGVGVGPGDPELLTLKAIRMIEQCDVIVAPDSGTSPQVALAIAAEYVKEKPIVSLHLPMTRDASQLAACRTAAAATICDYLEEGKTAVYLTLGDPTIYSTYTYLHKLVVERGYEARIVPGITSFCAAASALGTPLCEAGEPLHILPSSYQGADDCLELSGTKVLMKSGKLLGQTLQELKRRNLLRNSMLAERVGLAGEQLHRSLTGDEDSGYFSVVVVKDKDRT